jgi:hypothetical protein
MNQLPQKPLAARKNLGLKNHSAIPVIVRQLSPDGKRNAASGGPTRTDSVFSGNSAASAKRKMAIPA